MNFRTAVLGAGWVAAVAVAFAWRALAPRCPLDTWSTPPGVAATVDGHEIPWEDVDLDVLAALAQAGVRYEGPTAARQLRDLRQAMRERAVERLLLQREASRRGHRADPAAVQAAREKLWSQVPEGTLLHRLLRERRWEQALRRRAEANVLVEQLLADLRAQSSPSEEELRAYYRENLGRFREPEAAFFRQVVTPDRAAAEEVARRLRAGEPIEALGQRFAPDRSGFENGRAELRMFRGNPDPREPVLFRLRPGEVSDPVELSTGFAVLRLERRTPPRELRFEEVRDQLDKTLAARKFDAALRQLVRRLRETARITRSPLPEAETPAPSPSPTGGR